MKLLFIGDIVGKPGREILSALVPKVRVERGIDFVIANGENAAAGAGITGSLCKAILEAGVDVITLGDHVWDQKGFERDIATFERVCRPANLPAGNPGRDHVIVEKNGFRSARVHGARPQLHGPEGRVSVSRRRCAPQETGRPV
jgi:calcineurin-like phosphoesterase